MSKVDRMVFPVVGIGASAGGLEALSDLLADVSPTTGMAFLVVQHLDPGHHSLLSEILSKRTSMPVREVVEGMTILADHIYVIPPNTTLTLVGDVLRLQDRAASEHRHTPIDVLLASIAAERAHLALGVILSGGGSDGTLGLLEIKKAGGITFAQDPKTTKFDSMPRSAIEKGCVDFILPADALAQALNKFSSSNYLHTGKAMAEISEIASDVELKDIFSQISQHSGIDFTHYKRSSVIRRITRRMAIMHIDHLSDYADYVRSNKEELDALGQDLLIRVTEFFRNPESFEGLLESVFPVLLEKRSRLEPMRIWVPGCASGEEAYSIAICLSEFLAERQTHIPIQIFATDLSEAALTTARRGKYPANIATQMSAGRLQRYFVAAGGHFQILNSIRDMCIFARQDVTRDPPFSRIDLISCRNLLIYLSPMLQAHVISQFHYALKSHCFLVLGLSERISQFSHLFDLADKQHKIYRRQAGPAHLGLSAVPESPIASSEMRALTRTPNPVQIERSQREVERLLLARFAPACILVNSSLNILYFQGETSRYLEHVRGLASFNLSKVTRAC